MNIKAFHLPVFALNLAAASFCIIGCDRPVYVDQRALAVEMKLVQVSIDTYRLHWPGKKVTMDALIEQGLFEESEILFVDIIDYGSGPVIVPKDDVLVKSQRAR